VEAGKGNGERNDDATEQGRPGRQFVALSGRKEARRVGENAVKAKPYRPPLRGDYCHRLADACQNMPLPAGAPLRINPNAIKIPLVELIRVQSELFGNKLIQRTIHSLSCRG